MEFLPEDRFREKKLDQHDPGAPPLLRPTTCYVDSAPLGTLDWWTMCLW